MLLTIFPQYPKGCAYYKHADQHLFARAEGGKYGLHVLDLLETMAHCRQSHSDSINADNLRPSAVGPRCSATAMTWPIPAENLHR